MRKQLFLILFVILLLVGLSHGEESSPSQPKSEPVGFESLSWCSSTSPNRKGIGGYHSRPFTSTCSSWGITAPRVLVNFGPIKNVLLYYVRPIKSCKRTYTKKDGADFFIEHSSNYLYAAGQSIENKEQVEALIKYLESNYGSASTTLVDKKGKTTLSWDFPETIIDVQVDANGSAMFSMAYKPIVEAVDFEIGNFEKRYELVQDIAAKYQAACAGKSNAPAAYH